MTGGSAHEPGMWLTISPVVSELENVIEQKHGSPTILPAKDQAMILPVASVVNVGVG